MAVTLANEQRCETFKGQFSRFDYLWTKDLHTTLNEFLEAEGKVGGGAGGALEGHIASHCCCLVMQAVCLRLLTALGGSPQASHCKKLLLVAPCRLTHDPHAPEDRQYLPYNR